MAVQKENLILIGGGGHCKSCIDVIERTGEFNITGILDLPEKKGTKILNYEVIGSDDDISSYAKSGHTFFITLGQIKSAAVRKAIFCNLKAMNAKIATIYAPGAYVSKHAKIEMGTILMHGAVVNAGAKIGENCIINTRCTIEHDVQIGNHCHISTHAVINGDCELGNEVFVGSNATLSNQVKLSDQIIIGTGSVVLKSITVQGTYAGNPAKKI
jgi:sugar O-acyltransferase (sialic acid O-acetyltransferase NeuD family)